MTKVFYELCFIYENDVGKHYFQIGYFSSKTKIAEAIDMLKNKPGFSNFQEGFEWNQFEVQFSDYVVDGDEVVIYELSYEKHNEYDGTDDFIIFGIYSSHSSALNEQKRLSEMTIYADYVQNFCIAPKKVDNIEWVEGFSSW